MINSKGSSNLTSNLKSGVKYTRGLYGMGDGFDQCKGSSVSTENESHKINETAD